MSLKELRNNLNFKGSFHTEKQITSYLNLNSSIRLAVLVKKKYT